MMPVDRLRSVPTAVLAAIVPVVAIVTTVVTLQITSAPPSATATATANGNTISIKNFTFSPSPSKATSGRAITVRNADATAHTITADDGSFDTGHIEGGGRATITIDAPGTYSYHCDIHNYMTGKITVR
jgi:plastocyanin